MKGIKLIKFEDHVKRCIEILGEGFLEVHKYLP